MFVSCSTRQRVGWRDYAGRKMKTWLCPGLPRLCNTRADCTVIMNQSKRPSSCGQLRVNALCRTKCHVPISCSSSQLVLRTWMLPSLASPIGRRCRLHADDRSISLVGFRARRCSFPAQSRNHVRLQHSEKVGVSCFHGFGSHVVSVLLLFSPYSDTLSRELRDVDV